MKIVRRLFGLLDGCEAVGYLLAFFLLLLLLLTGHIPKDLSTWAEGLLGLLVLLGIVLVLWGMKRR